MRAPAAVVAWTLAALQLVMLVARVILDEAARPVLALPGASLFTDAIGAITGLIAPAVGILILARRPAHPIGWLFCALGLGWAVNNFAGSYARQGLVAHPGSLPGAVLGVSFYSWPALLSLGFYALLLFIFPDGRFLSRRWRALGLLALGWTAVGALTLAIAPGPVDDSIGFAVDNPFPLLPAAEPLRALAGLAQLGGVAFLVVGAAAMIIRFRRSRGVERLQLKWFTASVLIIAVNDAAAAVLLSVFPTVASLPWWGLVVNQLAIVLTGGLIPIGAGIAILRYRLYDIDLLINRTLVYGALSALLALAYVLGIVLFQTLLRPITSGSEIAVTASTLAVIALFGPLRSRIQKGVDRRFYRRRYDAGATVDAFALRLRDSVDLDALTQELLSVVGDTVQPAHASVWLRERRA